MEEIRQQIISYFMEINKQYGIAEFYHTYKIYINTLTIFLISFICGRFTTKRNEFERYIRSFISSKRSEGELRNRRKVYTKIDSYIKWGRVFYFIFVFVAILILNFEEMLIDNTSLKDKAVFLLNKSMNSYLIGFTFTFLLLCFLSRKYLIYVKSTLKTKIENVKMNKTTYVQKFFELLGTEMMEEMRKYLIKGTEEKEKKVVELEESHKKISLDLSLTQDKLLKSQNRYLLYKGFVDQIVSFDWCDDCYGDRADQRKKIMENRKELRANSVRHMSTKKRKSQGIMSQPNEVKNIDTIEYKVEKSNSGVKQAIDTSGPIEKKISEELCSDLSQEENSLIEGCKENCVARYLLFCEKIGSEFATNIKNLKYS